ncbi:MAG: L-histidine N(alpha)-methyltransferase [Cyclobacteriaceae bacterium]|nr:L-histidine N(alpha)-methyltransferase [Cyclobacteriaceae bacterium]MCH8516646.1 L-histidine N(alpha)-methyltransferase [Cyclobacteriaceae bacterium]
MNLSESAIDQNFAQDVMSGLKASEKHLPSMYFYNDKGDKLFQEIMAMPEYYLTNSEAEILNLNKSDIVKEFLQLSEGRPLRLVELGAGDGTKTKILLEEMSHHNKDFTYSPVDISANVLQVCETNVKKQLPNLKFEALNGDYFSALADLKSQPEVAKIVFFLGSNIGNFHGSDRTEFMRQLTEHLNPGDAIFMGIDLKKDPHVILEAYNDRRGITKSFNMNLLERMNKELGANFDLDAFIHYPIYNPQSGECKSYLLSTKDQEVIFKLIDEKVTFESYESIFMEVSKKFSLSEVQQMALDYDCLLDKLFFDEKRFFVDALFVKQ